MKELKMYQCEVCGTQFADKKKAEECEHKHRKVIKMISAKYRPYTSAKDGIPDNIIVEFDDGKKIRYVRGQNEKYLVVKFSEHQAFLYIVEAQNAEHALTLFFGVSKCIGTFKADNLYGDGGFAIELEGDEYVVSEAIQPLAWLRLPLK